MTREWSTTRDGRRLHVERAGQGTPTVVFEAGMGASRHMWGAVAPEVARRAAVLTYDRAGLGRSPADPAPRPLARLADDLVDVIRVAVDGPVVLVGHSWGGPVVRVAAAVEPERVAGLVLVDVTDERCDLFFGRGNVTQTRWMPRLMPVAARLGLVRRATRGLAASLPEPAASGLRAEDTTVAAARAMAAELVSSIDDLRDLRADPPVLPDVPVTIISGTKTSWFERSRRPALVAVHRTTAASLPQGRHVEAMGSGHYVPFTEPSLVVTEILRVIDAAEA